MRQNKELKIWNDLASLILMDLSIITIIDNEKLYDDNKQQLNGCPYLYTI